MTHEVAHIPIELTIHILPGIDSAVLVPDVALDIDAKKRREVQVDRSAGMKKRERPDIPVMIGQGDIAGDIAKGAWA